MNEAALAADLLAVRARGGLLAMPDGLDLPAAYRVAALIDRQRVAAGDQPRGWKIGFTNRGIWPRYGVHQPIWARVWDSTLTLLEGTEAAVSLAGLVQPRIEPEIVFGFARTPAPGADLHALAACLAWVAHGVEIVHTHLDGWRFGGAAEPVADFGLHGRLLVGPRRPLADFGDEPARALAALSLALRREGQGVDSGHGVNVLDGPLHALQHWLAAMAQATPGVAVLGGDVVTTGTLTDAWPVAAGQHWSTHLDDARLPGLNLHFEA